MKNSLVRILFVAALLVVTNVLTGLIMYRITPRLYTIQGSLSYPSQGIPSDMTVCAERIEKKQLYCISEQIQDEKFRYGIGYKLVIPSGAYRFYSFTSALPEYKAYYSEFVTCGLSAECRSHEPITLIVNRDVSNVDPSDWYKR